MMAKPYPYQPLDAENQEFRILHLSPGLQHEPVRATLEHVSVAKGRLPAYETISYVWGDPTRRAGITLGEHTLHVPSSTEAALKRVRLTERPRTVWIDSVCINQGEVAERGRQVAMMAKIYTGSTGNLVNLGELEDDDIANRIEDFIEVVTNNAKSETDDFKMLLSVLQEKDSSDSSSNPQPLMADDAIAERILTLPWFR